MAKTNNKHSGGFFSTAFGVAKKITSVGVDILYPAAPQAINTMMEPLNGQIIEGVAYEKKAAQFTKNENPQQIFREYVPNLSRQLLGRHYRNVNRVVNFVSPQLSDKVSDYCLGQMNILGSKLGSVEFILDQSGVKKLQELTQNVDRSYRLSQALAEQNKWIATVQGALTAVTGTLGVTLDVPITLVMSLRTIYQVGRSYGFELNKEIDQEIVQFIFKQIDLSLLAEKQAILMVLKAVSNTWETHDVSQLQQLLGSANNFEIFKQWLSDENSEIKWSWLNQITHFSLLNKLIPVANVTVGVLYNRRLVTEVSQKAQQVFSQARQYLQHHSDETLSPIVAYEKSLALLAQTSPKLLANVDILDVADGIELNQDVDVDNHATISKIQIQKKSAPIAFDENKIDINIQQGIEQLAQEVIEPQEHVVAKQKAALTQEEDNFLLEHELIEDSNEMLTKNPKAK